MTTTDREGQQPGIGAQLGGHLRENGMVLALLVIVLFFTVLIRSMQGVDFLSAQNITNLFLQNSYVIIMALGMLLVIVSGHIDLSVGSVAAFTGAVSAFLTVKLGWPVWAVIPATLLMGGLIGAAQGYWIAFWKIPSFIVTLAGMLVFRGLTLWLLQGQNIGPFPRAFQAMSTGFLPDVFGAGRPNITALVMVGLAALAIVWSGVRGRRADASFGIEPEPAALFWGRHLIVVAALMFVGWKLAQFRGLPNVLIVMSVLIVLYAFFTEQTVIGRRIYALGGNEKAARLSGIKTDRLVFATFANMGVLAALAGMIVTARLNSATPKAGTGFELDVIAAVFIGGASMAGGSGRIIGVVVGALIMGVMNNGMSIMGIGIDYQQVIKGLVLLAAVIFDVYNRNKQG
ncbi:multiple monosaccharide ABC transporter permease [Paracoccus sanguinis]|uniref:Xylose transport system permease protein XylH n=1 Tax=Paracoccus sanguinis TaxID=1545044 RepID=A0A099G1L2_9RHOB|nr:multiple monosaccharide ABC transporter permease [Paracoccus sanguinis]KGJ15866.1 ABC transporter permease [Paracoccus sanguinis]KGJ16719.1 ABC transporter permease [Paracoccus sanguinis]SDX02464.1 multiple monosaccharide ABC transporter membrane protein [Paracoccus sanguinis]